VDLLKKEGLSSEHAPEYVDVLDRQSQRLKKLTEDLVEASKASTGNIQAQPEDVDVNLLLSQAAGEYAERLAAAGLTTVTTWDPSEPHIRADGRLLWRVFDNLLSNVCKYALPGTRVYLSTEAKAGKVQITFRNVSRESLNISAEELMERFVRGDVSRSTEGSGLGLSIARSLTELNSGTLELTIDGDLFKATLIFDKD
jgi:signal transduction histidine kinase